MIHRPDDKMLADDHNLQARGFIGGGGGAGGGVAGRPHLPPSLEHQSASYDPALVAGKDIKR